ncbi:MAG: YkgJ family cysteine cluster protein [Acidobacteriota bacterium]|nr:YkgJ family cysteine cluster protein [Acidobacteriota bacterium]
MYSRPMDKDSNPPIADWYAEGLRFDCHGCGSCCRGEGYVWVDRAAARGLAKHFGLGVDEFGSRYLRRVRRRYSLTEKDNHDCIFWSTGGAGSGGCEVYDARPPQCRTFPFWSDNLESEGSWGEAAKTCRGMNSGRLYEIGEIHELSSDRGETTSPDSEGGAQTSCGCSAIDKSP